MSKTIEMMMPKLGEGVIEATVLQWIKSEGDSVEEGEIILEIATDKVDAEVTAEFAGKIVQFLVQENDIITIGAPICVLEVNDALGENGEAPAPPQNTASTLPLTYGQLDTASQAVSVGQNTLNLTSADNIHTVKDAKQYLSPLVKNIADVENIPLKTLKTIQGSGQNNRITKHDIQRYIQHKKNQSITSNMPNVPPPDLCLTGNEDIVKMDRMRKMIADRMLQSSQISAHISSFIETDVSNIIKWRDQHKASCLKKHHLKLTFTPIFAQAIAKAIADFPMINVSVNGDEIIKRKDINLGFAVSLPNGNLIVPVIKNADKLSLLELAFAINSLAEKARNNTLEAGQLKGGTYTFSNIGMFKNIMGTPLIMQPQVAILAIDAIVKKPAVIETPEGDIIGIRHKMILSHSYDHRVVDGALGGLFLKKVNDYLEDFDLNQLI